MKIRIATVDDADAIVAIYAPIVANRTISFEVDPPPLPGAVCSSAALGYFQHSRGARCRTTRASLHESVGFEPFGIYRDVGFKLGARRAVGCWQRALQPPSLAPAPVDLNRVEASALLSFDPSIPVLRWSLPMSITFQQFEADALARGFDEVLERKWSPNQVVDEHRHPFAADALVVEGEMWLIEASGTRHLEPGDTFKLEPGVPHSERYGPAGAVYWVARRDRGVA